MTSAGSSSSSLSTSSASSRERSRRFLTMRSCASTACGCSPSYPWRQRAGPPSSPVRSFRRCATTTNRTRASVYEYRSSLGTSRRPATRPAWSWPRLAQRTSLRARSSFTAGPTSRATQVPSVRGTVRTSSPSLFGSLQTWPSTRTWDRASLCPKPRCSCQRSWNVSTGRSNRSPRRRQGLRARKSWRSTRSRASPTSAFTKTTADGAERPRCFTRRMLSSSFCHTCLPTTSRQLPKRCAPLETSRARLNFRTACRRFGSTRRSSYYSSTRTAKLCSGRAASSPTSCRLRKRAP
mmetsp:Transcript_21301/g.67853  ORF Transcript_21301/g.67853 Transcript_21301/m.67853 type:complete len:294 (+) Transcript_21301:605-1486(+)